MDLVRVGLPKAALLRWQAAPGAFRLTVVCKATYQLAPGVSSLAPEQEDVREADVYGADGARGSLRIPGDLAPAKPRADVVLVGHAYSPRREPLRALVARFTVLSLDKAVEVVADRAFALDGALREGAPFVRMALTYERAAGGPSTWNPVGVRPDARTPQGQTILPNLVPVGASIVRPGDTTPPIGFGPISPTWPLRRDKLGVHAELASSKLAALAESPLPPGFDFGFFQVAPPDQQLPALPDDGAIAIVLENLHPEFPRLATRLSAPRPLVTVELSGRPAAPLAMRGDSLWIDTDRGLCTLTWRGQLALSRPDEAGRIVVAAEAPKAHIAVPASLSAPLRYEDDGEQTLLPRAGDKPVLPFSRSDPPPAPRARASEVPPRGSEGASIGEGEVVQLLWFAPESMPRIRRRKAWRVILDEVEQQPIDPELDDPELSATPADVENRRDLGAILVRGEPSGPEGLGQAMNEGISGGTFTPKITLVAGEIVFPFDEIGYLRSYVLLATPLSLEDEKLRTVVRAAGEFCGMAGASTAPAVAEGFSARIRETLRMNRRTAAVEAIESQVERSALEQRAYQKRTVFGGAHLRGILVAAPGASVSSGVPVYLPERIGAELPMMQRFRVRMLAEVHPAVDQQEAQAFALRGVAVGRVLGVGRR